MRDFQKLKTLDDYNTLDKPIKVYGIENPYTPTKDLMILRMLVRPKYGTFKIPDSLSFLKNIIEQAYIYDKTVTGISQSWCYVTIRSGKVTSKTDDEWHFDGSSFRTDIIPERNYIWTDCYPTEYKTGTLSIPKDFDPLKHNLFTFADKQTHYRGTDICDPKTWYLLSPFVLHRRPELPEDEDINRTFIRICFTDIEGRDINNTLNPLIPTCVFGRDPVRTFRDKLENYK